MFAVLSNTIDRSDHLNISLRLMFNIQTKTLLKQPVNVWLQAKLPTASLSNRSWPTGAQYSRPASSPPLGSVASTSSSGSCPPSRVRILSGPTKRQTVSIRWWVFIDRDHKHAQGADGKVYEWTASSNVATAEGNFWEHESHVNRWTAIPDRCSDNATSCKNTYVMW